MHLNVKKLPLSNIIQQSLWPPDVKSWLTGKDPDSGRFRAGGEGGKRGWDSWMASLTQWVCLGDG